MLLRPWPLLLTAVVEACGGRPRAPSPALRPASPGAPPPDAAASLDEQSSVAPPPGPSVAASVAPVPRAKSDVAAARIHPAWASCVHGRQRAAASEVAKVVAEAGAACAPLTKMKPVAPPSTGTQADQDAPQTLALPAKSGRCYRVYAQASDGVRDLDLVVEDSAGIAVGEDSTAGPSPVVLEDGAVCFARDDAAKIVVSVGAGAGTYAVQVWSD